MKRILLVCFLALGTYCFAATNIVINNLILVEEIIIENIKTVTVGESNEGYFRCRADIYYKDQYVRMVSDMKKHLTQCVAKQEVMLSYV